jgi:hypothetical protein
MVPLLSRPTKPRTLLDIGANANAILCGAGTCNAGFRLQVCEARPRGIQGPVLRPPIFLDAGHNKRSAALLHRSTGAAEILTSVRVWHPCCVNAANANLLVAEGLPRPGAGAPESRG